jgi:hypothetical protein
MLQHAVEGLPFIKPEAAAADNVFKYEAKVKAEAKVNVKRELKAEHAVKQESKPPVIKRECGNVAAPRRLYKVKHDPGHFAPPPLVPPAPLTSLGDAPPTDMGGALFPPTFFAFPTCEPTPTSTR